MPGESYRDFEGKVENIVIESPGSELEVLSEVEVEDYDGTKKVLFLSKGGNEKDAVREDKSKLAEIKSTDDGKYTQIIFPDEYGAIGAYIYALEQYNTGNEESVMQELRNLNIPLGDYISWRDDLTIEERQNRAIEQAKERTHKSPHIERYLKKGAWRNIKHNDKLSKFGQHLYDGINPHSRRCYENSAKAVKAINNDNLKYVEGFALSKHAGRIAAHSWVEFKGYVIELTWPWHAPLPPENTVYYGVTVNTDDIISSVRKRGFSPYHLTDEELIKESNNRN